MQDITDSLKEVNKKREENINERVQKIRDHLNKVENKH